MATASTRNQSAYLLCEGVIAGSGPHGGAGIVVRGPSRRRVLATTAPIRTTSQAGARFAALAEALRLARRLGYRRITVYCQDPSVVDQVARRQPTVPETRCGCLEVRALMNTFHRAEVRSVPWPANLEAAWLARQAAARPPQDITRRVQRSLPLDAA